jgi:CheY-like chemotaxis protein
MQHQVYVMGVTVPQGSKTASPRREGAMATVLVVDDDDGVRWTLKDFLMCEGFEVIEAADGAEGLEQLRQAQQPMVVLLDLMMPRLNGAGLLRAVVEDWVLRTQNAYILITADRTVSQDRTTLSISPILTRLAIPVISKPFDLMKLLDTVRQKAQDLERRRGYDTAI